MADWIQPLLDDPAYHTVLSIIKGFRNGAVYGAKVRFPHALVMTFLFRDGTWQQKLAFVLKATRQHAKSLASYVAIYKTVMALQRLLDAKKKQHSWHPLLAGLIGGYLIYGNDNPINQQMILYLLSRVIMAAAKAGVKRGVLVAPAQATHPYVAAVTWAAIMWLFYNEKETVHPSLRSSMVYLYDNAEKWTTWKTWLWHNS